VMELKIPPEVVTASFGDVADCHMSLAGCVACYEPHQERFLIRGDSISALEGAKQAIADSMAASGFILKVEGDEDMAPIPDDRGGHPSFAPQYPPAHNADRPDTKLSSPSSVEDDYDDEEQAAREVVDESVEDDDSRFGEEEEEAGPALGELGSLFHEIKELRERSEVQETAIQEAQVGPLGCDAFRATNETLFADSAWTLQRQRVFVKCGFPPFVFAVSSAFQSPPWRPMLF